MVLTRNQKKIIESKEKIAVQTLLSLSEMDICEPEPEPEDTVFNEPYKWTNDEINSQLIGKTNIVKMVTELINQCIIC